MKKRWIAAFAFSLLAMTVSLCYAAGMMPSPKKQGKEIRVLLADKQEKIELKVEGSFSLWSAAKKGILLSTRMKGPLQFRSEAGRLKLGKKDLAVPDATLLPSEAGGFTYQGKKYRGMAKLFVNPDGKVALVNVLDLEDYLKSVVAGEISASWPDETLKAQAIAARTYATYHLIRNQGKRAHITSPLAQNYQGLDQEEPRTTAAVAATQGQVLLYKGYIFPTFFHSTCGGGTEFPQNVWPLHFKLPEIVPCDYCKDSPYYRWKVSLTVDEIEKKFKEAGVPVHSIESVYPSKISKNRVHVTEVTLVDDSKEEKKVRVNDFRRVLGYNVVKSARFKMDQEGDRVVLRGWGWGHGVGLCQWGSRAMAQQQQQTYRDILKFYYPGSELKKVKS